MAASSTSFRMRSGTCIHGKGYPRLSAGPLRHKYVHILVAEAIVGRELREDEDVHHRDGNKKNPQWSNLIILGKDVHGAVSKRQHWYLKQKYSAEYSAWRAYFDVTGETPEDAILRQNKAAAERVATSFDPAHLTAE